MLREQLWGLRLAKPRISVAELRRIVSYDPKSGVICWLIRPARNVFPGDEAGSIDGQGYRHFMFKKVNYPCHQVAWALLHGEWPLLDVDHQDGNRSNNSEANLRLATVAQNHANRKLAKNNKSGAKGVCFKRGKWEVSIGYTDAEGQRRQRYLSRHEDFDLAKIIHDEAAAQMHGEFFREV